MKIQNIIFIFSLSIVIGCSTTSEIKIPKDEIILEKKERKITQEIFPINAIENNGKMIIANDYTKENIFSVFDLQSMEYLYSFGNIGKSNLEFLNTYSIAASKYMEVMDFYVIKYVDIQDSTARIVSTKSLPMIALNTFGKIDDSLYYTSDKVESNDKELTIINTNNNTFKYIGEKPKWSDNVETGIFDCCYNDKNKKLAFFYNLYPEFKIMDLNGENVKKVKIKVGNSINLVDDLSTYFINTKATDKFIYATWINKSHKYLDNNKKDIVNTNLLIIDWDGNIRANCLLSGWQKVLLVNNDKKLYSLSIENRSIINEYDLPIIN